MLILLCDTMTPTELNTRHTAAEEAEMQNIFFTNFHCNRFL
jgi:hypothetical protein